MSINRVVLSGRITKDPEPLRTTTAGKDVITFTLAVQKRPRPTDGSPDAHFIQVTAWEGQARFVVANVTKGRLLMVDGRLNTRKFTTQDGQAREMLEVVADNVEALGRPSDDQGEGRAQTHD